MIYVSKIVCMYLYLWCCCFFLCFVFCFKQKTAYEMRISDWSSDVCSSDLHAQDSHHLPDVADIDGQRGKEPGRAKREHGQGQHDDRQQQERPGEVAVH